MCFTGVNGGAFENDPLCLFCVTWIKTNQLQIMPPNKRQKLQVSKMDNVPEDILAYVFEFVFNEFGPFGFCKAFGRVIPRLPLLEFVLEEGHCLFTLHRRFCEYYVDSTEWMIESHRNSTEFFVV